MWHLFIFRRDASQAKQMDSGQVCHYIGKKLIRKCLTTYAWDGKNTNLMILRLLQMNAEMQEQLLMLLRGQQRELTELRGQIEAMQSTIMSQVEHALNSHHETERILYLLDSWSSWWRL